MQFLPAPSLWSLPSSPGHHKGRVGEAIKKKPELLQLGRKAAFSTLCARKEASAAQGLPQLLEATLLLLSLCWKEAIPLLSPPGLMPAQLYHTQSIYFAFTQGWLLHFVASWLTLANVPRHSRSGRMPPGWKCHKPLFAVGKEQFLPWPACEMQNPFPAAARARRREPMTFNLSLPRILQTFHIKTF